MIATSTAPKPCQVCPKSFVPRNTMQQVCWTVACARKAARIKRLADEAREKEDRKQTRAKLDKLRPLSYWAKQAQTAFNAWIRHRDAAEPCISCGTTKAAQWDAGHYLSAGARPELRFNEANCHKQCSVCNQHFSGNVSAYRIELLRRVGQIAVDHLEGPHPANHWTRDELKALRDMYRRRLKAAPPEVF